MECVDSIICINQSERLRVHMYQYLRKKKEQAVENEKCLVQLRGPFITQYIEYLAFSHVPGGE